MGGLGEGVGWSWEGLGGLLGLLGSILGASWAPFGPSWDLLGASWEPPGLSWRALANKTTVVPETVAPKMQFYQGKTLFFTISEEALIQLGTPKLGPRGGVRGGEPPPQDEDGKSKPPSRAGGIF